jgi:hypothetical protein
MPARMPTRSDAVRNAGAELDDLARRLVAPHPPAVRGIALVNLLVTDGTGPLYSGDGAASWCRRCAARGPRSSCV